MITDEEKLLTIQLQNDRGILKKEIRSYEVSLWTLLDEFITVLKWSDAEQKGRIEKPILTLNVDGTLKFTFTIPMYYRLDGKLIENPNWYTILNGQLIMGMRKIKIIFNKGEEYKIEDDEERTRVRSSNTFELLITKVNENHEEDLLRCEVECEGLAFHELGKIGYKINLSLDNFLLIKKEWDESLPNNKHWIKRDGTVSNQEPILNILFWCEEGCGLIPVPDNKSEIRTILWYYKICMNWDSFKGNRDSTKIYEESYVSSWKTENNLLVPADTVEYREKSRPIEIKESNLYNITLELAKTFGIYCRYEYGYDDNYHIISREIIFYNNYFDEKNIVSFTYPYTTKLISREMDSTDIITKMYVRPQDSDIIVGGQLTIADCPANRMREDYLLNFDYMYTSGAITKELYESIPLFEIKVRDLNVELDTLYALKEAQEKIKIELSAEAEIYHNSMILDLERIDYNSEFYKRLDLSDGYGDGLFTRDPSNPYSTYIKKDKTGGYFISFNSTDKGIKIDTLRIFRFSNSALATFKAEISKENYRIINDTYGEPSQIELLNFSESFLVSPNSIKVVAQDDISNPWADTLINGTGEPTNSNSLLVYLIYKYKPTLYYDKINNIWMTKLKNDTKNYNDAKLAAEAAEQKLNDEQIGLNKKIDEKLRKKEQLLLSFLLSMGPALREGYWLPDDYKDYGDNKIEGIDSNNLLYLSSSYNSAVMINNSLISNNGITTYVTIGWDSELFNGENKNYYEESVLLEKVYYPCIKLTSQMIETIGSWLQTGKIVSFIFNNNYYKSLQDNELTLPLNIEIFSIGSGALFGFVTTGENQLILPVIILTGTESMSLELINFMIGKYNNGNNDGTNNRLLKIGITEVNMTEPINSLDESKPIINIIDSINITKDDFLDNPANYFIVYPRIKISNNNLNTNSIKILYNNIQLENFIDYSVLSRVVNRGGFDEHSESLPLAHFEYFIAVKPETLIKNGAYTDRFIVSFTLSNATTSIYLDALQVMYDSSRPRVSYTVDVNALNINYLKTLYRNLAELIMINDTDLKFNNVFGYISQLTLDLDAPWEDQIEVKNYKTKFEDLFTTIVASSEAMRQNAAALAAAANGQIPLEDDALIKMIVKNSSILNTYLDAGLDSSAYLKTMLADIFTEAGAIIATAEDALNDVHSLTIKNSNILAGFVENITANLIPKVINSKTLPTIFKVGDIWNEVDASGKIIGRYIATSSSKDSGGGYTRTFDGSLAAIKGASLNVDAVTGLINIEAENLINIKSGGNLYIAANDKVDIVGNKTVNIGGGRINIAGSTNDINGNVTDYTSGEINIVSAKINFKKNNEISVEQLVQNAIDDRSGNISKVLIHPDKIEMGGANIIMKGSNLILMKVSRNTSATTSALSIDPENGIWIGSRKGIILYSGEVTVEENNNGTFSIANNNATGTSIELVPDHLLFGVSNVSNNNNATAIKMTKDYIILAGGGQVYSMEHAALWQANHRYEKDTIVKYNSNIYICKTTHQSAAIFESDKWQEHGIIGTSGGLIGAKFTATSIGFATKNNNNNINAILMNDKGITIGSGIGGIDLTKATSDLSGSFVRIAADGISLGSLANLSVNTKNLKLLSDRNGNAFFAMGTNVSNITSSTSFSNLSGVNFLLNNNGLYINGNSSITMTSGSSFIFSTANEASAFKLDSNGASIHAGNLQLQSHNSIFIIDNTGLHFNALTSATDTTVELLITKDGAMINNGTFGPWQLTISGFLSEDGTMGWKKTNNSNTRAFWIYHDNKPAFYYQNGIVYIRELRLYKELEYSSDGVEFGESLAGYTPPSGSGSTSSEGGTAPTVVTQEWYHYGSPYVHYLVVNGDKTDITESHESKIYDGYMCKCGYQIQ